MWRFLFFTGALGLFIYFLPSLCIDRVCDRAAAVSDDLETARESNLFRTDPDRFLALEFVKAFPVHAASPFSLAEAEPVRRFFSLMRKNFNVGCLNNKAVSIMAVNCVQCGLCGEWYSQSS